MKRVVWLTTIALSFAALDAAAAQSQGPELGALKAELAVVKAGLAAVQQDLQEIKQLLQGRPAQPAPEPAPERFATVAGAPSKGDAAARVTLIEFSDFQCAFCGRYVNDTLAQIEKTYVSTGKVRYVFRHFPIEAIHPLAFKAHETAGCAAEQGKFWEMHARLFGSPELLDPKELPKHAAAIGLDAARFQVCMETGRTAAGIRRDIAEGRTIGANATPMFFLALTEPNDGKVKVVRVLRGAQSLARFQEAIDSLLTLPR
jgi:protein-disulfide isomerase